MGDTKAAETWAVVDEAGAIHEVDVEAVQRRCACAWRAHTDTASALDATARGAVVALAVAEEWGIAEVLAPGVVSRATLERERDTAVAEAARLREAQREAIETLHHLSHAQQRRASGGSEAARAKAEAYTRAADIVAASLPGGARAAEVAAEATAACAERERLRVEVATARAEGAWEMQRRALAEARNAESPRDIIDAILALPLPGGAQ